MRRDEVNGETVLTAAVNTPEAITPARVAALETALRRQIGAPVRLVVRSVLTQDADAHGFLYSRGGEPAPLSGWALQFHERMQRALTHQLERAGATDATLMDFNVTQEHRTVRIRATVQTPRLIEPGQVAQMEDALRQYIYPKTELTVHSILGADASATALITPASQTSPLRQRLERALVHQLSSVGARRATVVSLAYAVTGGRLRIRAAVQTPQIITPPQVSRIESALRTYVDPSAELTVTSRIVARADAAGWR